MFWASLRRNQSVPLTVARISVLSDQGKMADGWPSAGFLSPAFAGEDTGEMELQEMLKGTQITGGRAGLQWHLLTSRPRLQLLMINTPCSAMGTVNLSLPPHPSTYLSFLITKISKDVLYSLYGTVWSVPLA